MPPSTDPAVRPVTVHTGGNRTLEGVVRISATDGFSAYIAAPAAALVQREHPKVAVEIVAATRRATQQRSGLDVEIVWVNQRCIGPRRSGSATTAWACPEAVAVRLTYWLVTRAETLRRPEVAAVVEAIRNRVRDQQLVLLGAR